MLLHLIPQFYAQDGRQATLIRFALQELDLVLDGGVDLDTRRPYRNKSYMVGCRRSRGPAIAGLLLQLPAPIAVFTTEATWHVDGMEAVHRIHHTLWERDHPAATQAVHRWQATASGFSDRWPPDRQVKTPVNYQPRMELWPTAIRDAATYTDELDMQGRVRLREEWFGMPTVEPERLATTKDVPMPAPADAFLAFM